MVDPSGSCHGTAKGLSLASCRRGEDLMEAAERESQR